MRYWVTAWKKLINRHTDKFKKLQIENIRKYSFRKPYRANFDFPLATCSAESTRVK